MLNIIRSSGCRSREGTPRCLTRAARILDGDQVLTPDRVAAIPRADRCGAVCDTRRVSKLPVMDCRCHAQTTADPNSLSYRAADVEANFSSFMSSVLPL